MSHPAVGATGVVSAALVSGDLGAALAVVAYAALVGFLAIRGERKKEK